MWAGAVLFFGRRVGIGGGLEGREVQGVTEKTKHDQNGEKSNISSDIAVERGVLEFNGPDKSDFMYLCVYE